jgi:hypothetical protein
LQLAVVLTVLRASALWLAQRLVQELGARWLTAAERAALWLERQRVMVRAGQMILVVLLVKLFLD